MKDLVVGVGVPDDPSEQWLIVPHTELPPDGGRDVGDAIPYEWVCVHRGGFTRENCEGMPSPYRE